jgi:hypothetical protein
VVDGRLRIPYEDFREQGDHFLGLGQGLLTRASFLVREHLHRDEGVGIRDISRNVEIEAPLDGSALGDNCLECSAQVLRLLRLTLRFETDDYHFFLLVLD